MFTPDSQPARLLALLQSKSEVPLYEITYMTPRIADHRGVVSKLRKSGYNIEVVSFRKEVNGRSTHCTIYKYHGEGQEPEPKKQGIISKLLSFFKK